MKASLNTNGYEDLGRLFIVFIYLLFILFVFIVPIQLIEFICQGSCICTSDFKATIFEILFCFPLCVMCLSLYKKLLLAHGYNKKLIIYYIS